ncbi:MAG: hypothetical protein EP330_21815 [Deltaproteobacteria bacterium]|nr:MAG: hypothetical protein EP330_21815 [Deltaproteobacteria bacterium]
MTPLLLSLALGTALAQDPADPAPTDPAPADLVPEALPDASETPEDAVPAAETDPAIETADETPADPASDATAEPEPVAVEAPAEDPRVGGLSAEYTALARTALDDRRAPEERAEAVDALSAAGDPELLWILRAAARDREPTLQRAAIRGAARTPHPEAVSLLAWLAADAASDLDVRREALDVLAIDTSRDAGEALWLLASLRSVPSGLRTFARTALEHNHAELIAERGDPRPVTDFLGGTTFVSAWGVTGGVALSSVGVWGAFSGGAAIGAVGGSAIGLGTSIWYVSKTPISTGQGLAQATGVSWGLAAAQWTTLAVHGRPRFDYWDDTTYWDTRWKREQYGAGYRLAGVAAGSLLGAHWASKQPRTADVFEVNLATYLGSAVALAGTGLVAWKEPDWRDVWDENSERALYAQQSKQARALDASNLVGAAAGLGIGLAIQDRWELQVEDAVFASVLGLEAAWIGQWTPSAIGVDGSGLKGSVRLPWNGAIAGGLAIAELHPMSLQTSAVTATTAAAGNAIGAGVPMLFTEDEQTITQVMVPAGAVGTVAGIFAASALDPQGGDWALTGVATGLGATNLALIGTAARATPTEVAGLGLLGGGLGATGGLVAGSLVEPRGDHMLTLTTAAGWGAYYGLLTPIAAGNRLSDPGRALVAALGTDAFVGGTAVALSSAVGLEPRQTVVPQLFGLTGATTGALVAGLASTEPEPVATGSLIGATAGLLGGAALEGLRGRRSRTALVHLPGVDLPGAWSPVLAPTVVDGQQGVYLGVTGVGW